MVDEYIYKVCLFLFFLNPVISGTSNTSIYGRTATPEINQALMDGHNRTSTYSMWEVIILAQSWICSYKGYFYKALLVGRWCAVLHLITQSQFWLALISMDTSNSSSLSEGTEASWWRDKGSVRWEMHGLKHRLNGNYVNENGKRKPSILHNGEGEEDICTCSIPEWIWNSIPL